MFQYLKSNIFIIFILAAFSSTAFSNVIEVAINLNNMQINPSMSIDLSQRIENELSYLDDLADKKILAIDIEYKSMQDSLFVLNLQNTQMQIQAIGDAANYYLLRFTSNSFAYPTKNSQINLSGQINADLHLIRGEAMIKSLTISLGDRHTHYIKSMCRYRLDSIFGSATSIPFYRYSFGKTNKLANSFACYKAKQACKNRQYSKNLETCKKK